MFAQAFPWLTAAALLALPLALRPASAGSPASPDLGMDPPPRAGNPQGLPALPVAFIENAGQWDTGAAFAAQAGGVTLRAEHDGFALAVLGGRASERPEGAVVHLRFEGARAGATLAGEDELPGTYNFLIGNDPARWRSGAKGYGSVLYQGMLEGVDVRLRSAGRTLAYDLLLAPGAELDRCVVRCAGLAGLALEPDGALAMETSVGTLRQSVPVAWQVLASGERAPLAVRFRVLGPDRYGFEAPGRDPALALVVDPGLIYSATFGGLSGVDIALAVAADSSGLTTAAGYTDSFDFPGVAGSFDPSFNGFVDGFVARLSPNGGSLQYSTFLGGTGDDRAQAVALDASGAAVVAGYAAANFPTTPGAYDESHNGNVDAFVARLSPSGASLDFSTFVGSSGAEKAQGIALEPSGAMTLVGWTQSPTFPVQSAFDSTFNGGTDAFAARLAPGGGSLSWSTFLGGAVGTTLANQDAAYAVAVDASGGAVVAGETNSFDFPGGGPSVSFDAFLVRIVPTGDSLSLVLVLGGTSVERAEGVAVGSDGAAVVAGVTLSSDFPTTAGAFDTTLAGGMDAFAVKVNLTNGQFLYSTLIGGNGTDGAHAVALDPAGAATVAGEAASTDMPTTPGAFDTTLNGIPDAFVTRLKPDGSGLVYSTYVGVGVAWGVALDAAGAASVAGQAGSSFPITPGALGLGAGGGAFVARLDLLPTGVSAFGASTQGCTGPLAIGVNSLPKVGHGGFALTCNNAPPAAPGICLLTSSGLASPLPILGVNLWLDPAGPLFNPLAALADAKGSAVQPVPIPSNPAIIGASVSAQFAWIGPAAPAPCPPLGFSASNALKIVVQP